MFPPTHHCPCVNPVLVCLLSLEVTSALKVPPPLRCTSSVSPPGGGRALPLNSVQKKKRRLSCISPVPSQWEASSTVLQKHITKWPQSVNRADTQGERGTYNLVDELNQGRGLAVRRPTARSDAPRWRAAFRTGAVSQGSVCLVKRVLYFREMTDLAGGLAMVWNYRHQTV